jgi:hypothetical protein
VNGIKVAFVPSYCLTANRARLAKMTELSILTAVHLFDDGAVDHIIFSTAYDDAWKRERDLKLKLFDFFNVPREKLHCIGPITSSYDEVEGIRTHALKLKARRLILVAEEYHVPRAKKIILAKFPDSRVEVRYFKTQAFERTYEPHNIWILGKLKGLRTGYKWSWRLWNKVFEFLTPLMLRMEKSKY